MWIKKPEDTKQRQKPKRCPSKIGKRRVEKWRQMKNNQKFEKRVRKNRLCQGRYHTKCQKNKSQPLAQRQQLSQNKGEGLGVTVGGLLAQSTLGTN